MGFLISFLICLHNQVDRVLKGNLSGYEGTYTYKVDGDNLSLTQNGTTITLVKNK